MVIRGHDVVYPRPEEKDHQEAEYHDDGLGQLRRLGHLPLFAGLAELLLGRLFGSALVLRGEELQVETKPESGSSKAIAMYSCPQVSMHIQSTHARLLFLPLPGGIETLMRLPAPPGASKTTHPGPRS